MIANFTAHYPPTFDPFLKTYLPVSNYTILPLAGDASSRKYYRVVADTQSWVLMEWEPFENPDKFPFISIQKHFARHGIHVPEIIGFDAAKGLFLLEDLGDLTLERKFWEFQNQDNVMPFYKVTLDLLINLHRTSLKPAVHAECTAYQVQFDVEKLSWELNYTYKNLFTVLCPHQLNEAATQELQEEFTHIASTLANLPQVLCHRDLHSRNLMIDGDKIVFIDFQDARLGPPQYDLVSLVHDSYVQLDDAHIQALVDYYWAEFKELHSLFKNRDDFMNGFYLQMLQRCFKACGTFAAIFNQRSDRRYLKYLPGTLRKVHTALAHLQGYPRVRELVSGLQLPPIEVWP